MGASMLTETAITAVVPGVVARRRRRVFALATFGFGVVVPVAIVAATLLSGRAALAVAIDPAVMTRLEVAAVAALTARVVALGEVWLNARRTPTTGGREPGRAEIAATVAIAAVVTSVLTMGVVHADRARVSTDAIFTDAPEGPLSEPDQAVATVVRGPRVTVPPRRIVPVPTSVPTNAPTTREHGQSPPRYRLETIEPVIVPPPPDHPSSGIDPGAYADVVTILLLGGDAGPGRWSLRTDSIMLLSVHVPSGRAGLVSVPRNLQRLRFPPGSVMHDRYPSGFTDLANAVYPVVEINGSLADAYAVTDGIPAGVAALAEGISYSLDVVIDDFVLVDMRGFVRLIDALGGVTVHLDQRVPMPGNISHAPSSLPDSIGPGDVAMDGTLALGYARSRSGDSDYQRMERQRHLLAALADSWRFRDALASLPAVIDAAGDSLRTSLTPDELADLLSLMANGSAIVESVGLAPPLVNSSRPDWNRIAQIAAQVRVALHDGRPSGY